MADKFWVGGDGNWNTTDTTHWSDSDGGAGGAAVPTASDNVYFNNNSESSGLDVVLTSSTVVCADLEWSFAGGTISASANRTIAPRGNVFLNGSMITTANVSFSMQPASGTVTFNANSQTFGNFTVNAGSDTAIVQLDGNLNTNTSSRSVVLTRGILDTNNFNITTLQMIATGSLVKELRAGSSTITFSGEISGGTANGWNFSGSNTTVEAGSSIIQTSASGTGFLFNGGGLNYHIVKFRKNMSATDGSVRGSNGFNTLEITGSVVYFQEGSTQTITTLIANTGSTITWASETDTQRHFLNVGGYSIDRVTVRDSEVLNNTIYNPNGVDSGNNVNWFFTTNPNSNASNQRAGGLFLLQ